MADISSASQIISVPCPICKESLPAQVRMTHSDGYNIHGEIAFTVEFWAHIKDHAREADRD